MNKNTTDKDATIVTTSKVFRAIVSDKNEEKETRIEYLVTGEGVTGVVVGSLIRGEKINGDTILIKKGLEEIEIIGIEAIADNYWYYFNKSCEQMKFEIKQLTGWKEEKVLKNFTWFLHDDDCMQDPEYREVMKRMRAIARKKGLIFESQSPWNSFR